MSEPAKVIQLFPQKAGKMPERFSDPERLRLLKWAMANGLSVQELRYGIDRVRDWAATRAHAPLKRDWVRTVENAVSRGWALEGFQRFAEATSKANINPRTGRRPIRRTPITEEYIARFQASLQP